MSKICNLCGKRPVAGHNVSHSKRRTKRRFLPNLVSKKFGGRKVLICAACLRTLKKPEKEKKIVEKQVVEQEKVAKVDKVSKVEKEEKKPTAKK
ncbi:MAG: 50S ribosomal protein L28 [Patescibacteria group bacterium]